MNQGGGRGIPLGFRACVRAGGSNTRLTALVEGATSKARVSWTSSNPESASVDASGLVTPLLAGTTIITVKTRVRHKKANCFVWVTNPLSTIAGGFSGPTDMAFSPSEELYAVDNLGATIKKVGASGLVSVVAGTGKLGFSGDGGQATSAQLSVVQGIAIDTSGVLYIADAGNDRVRRVGSSGVITTVAGSASTGAYFGDGGPAVKAIINPQDVAVANSSSQFDIDMQAAMTYAWGACVLQYKKNSPDAKMSFDRVIENLRWAYNLADFSKAKLSSPMGP